MTKEEIIEQLKTIKNKYNAHNFDDASIEHRAKFIYEDQEGNEKDEERQKMSISFVKDEHYRELVKELSHVDIAKNKHGMHYIYVKRGSKAYELLHIFVHEQGSTLQEVCDIAEQVNTIYKEKCVKGTVEFPTGEIIFANFFKNKACNDYAFDEPEDVKYTDLYSINHSFGEQNTMRILSETHGLGYVQLGNTSAAVYKISDDKLIITSTWAYFYDEETDTEEDIPVPEGWEFLGEIDCDVWRVEFIDKQNFDKGDALPIDHKEYEYNKPFTGKVNPGTWSIINRYHHMRDEDPMSRGEIPVWVELIRKE